MEQGILRRDAEDAAAPPRPQANRSLVLLLGILAVASAVAMLVGGGQLLTWIGAGLFILVLWAFTWISIRAV